MDRESEAKSILLHYIILRGFEDKQGTQARRSILQINCVSKLKITHAMFQPVTTEGFGRHSPPNKAPSPPI